jgi:hypothetical protein
MKTKKKMEGMKISLILYLVRQEKIGEARDFSPEPTNFLLPNPEENLSGKNFLPEWSP